MSNPPRLNRKKASEYLLNRHGVRRAPQTLARLACEGRGPDYVSDGRFTLYTPESLDRWVASILNSSPARTPSVGRAA